MDYWQILRLPFFVSDRDAAQEVAVRIWHSQRHFDILEPATANRFMSQKLPFSLSGHNYFFLVHAF
ncbi:MAG: hypothetical protein KatS3mg105_0069 [Gemmatales bacterium]|nr:MAG: hypothetical protein KatS3mg105_0069 [Gemmatales bacterium]